MVIGPVEPNRSLPQQGGDVNRVSQSNKGAFSVTNPNAPIPVNPGQNAQDPNKGGRKDSHKKSIDARLQEAGEGKKAAPLPSEMEAARRKLFADLKRKEEEEQKKKEQDEEEESENPT